MTVPGFEDESFFVSKDTQGQGWTVSDATTGLGVGDGSTKKKAAQDAQANLARIGKQGLEDGRAQAREQGMSVEQLLREEDDQAEAEAAPTTEGAAPTTDPQQAVRDAFQEVAQGEGGRQKQSVKIADVRRKAREKGATDEQITEAITSLDLNKEVALTAGYDPDTFSREDVEETTPFTEVGDGRYVMQRGKNWQEGESTQPTEGTAEETSKAAQRYGPQDVFKLERKELEETADFFGVSKTGKGRKKKSYVELARDTNTAVQRLQGKPVVDSIESPGVAQRKFSKGDKVVFDSTEGSERREGVVTEVGREEGKITVKPSKPQAGAQVIVDAREAIPLGEKATDTTTEQEPRSLEPWEKTQQEYASSVSEAGGVVDDRAYERHKNIVTQAVNENKPVPQRVLDEYPELKQGGPQSTTTVVEPDRTESPQIKEETRRVPAIFVDQEGNTHSGSVEGNLVTIPVIIENLTFVVHESPQHPGWYSVTNVEHGIEASPVPKKDMQGAAAVTQKWAWELIQQGTSPTNFLRQKKDHFLKKAQQKEEAKAAEQQEFSQGDRVVVTESGRHGEVVNFQNIRMTDAVSGETYRGYQVVQVQTDNGAIDQVSSDKLQAETESPKGVVPDIKIKDRWVTPQNVMRHIEGQNERVQRMRRSAARRRKQEYKDKDNRRAQEAEEAAKELRQALQKWANQNPKAAQEAGVQKYLSTETEATVQDRPPQGERIEAYASYHTTHHAKKNIPLHVVTLDRRVDRDTFTQLKEKAKEHNGWYSSYNKRGAIPGFQFQTATDAANFAQLFTNPPNNLVPETQQEAQQTAPEGVTSEEAPEAAQKDPEYGENNQLVTKDRYEELRQRLSSKLNNLYTGFDPELLSIGTEMAAFHIEAGARSFADFSRRMIQDVGEKVKPYLKSFYKGARSYPGVESYKKEMDTDSDVDAFDLNQLDKESPEQIYFEDVDYDSPWWTPQEALQRLAELERDLERNRKNESPDSEVIELYETDIDTLKGTLRRWAADNPQESAKYAEEARRLGFEDLTPEMNAYFIYLSFAETHSNKRFHTQPALAQVYRKFFGAYSWA